ncbi:MAG: hypothetical protein QNJ33_14705 [Crocosphaera sp.]|nr:hypothetical protein [Crocosphaera sp.]
MDFLPFYQDYLENALSKSKFLLLRILVWLLQVHKQVRIERLAAYLPIPILYQSRRKKIQRFLVEPCLSLVLFWFPLIKLINVKEQIALIRPVLKLLSDYELLILGDREFHGVELSYWLKKRNRTAKKPIYFAFRERKDV